MARVSLPIQSEAARGKLGSKVYIAWRGLETVRIKVAPTQPRTSRQLDVRNILTGVIREYGNLTDGNVADWKTYATLIKKTDSLGQQYTPTAANMYLSLNYFRAEFGASSSTTPPVTAVAASIKTLTLTGGVNAGDLKIDWVLRGTGSASDWIWIELAGPFTSKQRVSSSSQYRYNSKVAGNLTTKTITGLTASGNYWVRVRYIDQYGQQSLKQTKKGTAHV